MKFNSKFFFGVFLFVGSLVPAYIDAFADPITIPARFNRADATVFYDTEYLASEGVPSGWNGNVVTGIKGSVTEAFKEATLRRVNWFRVMAGVPGDVILDAGFDDKSQQAALMMSANKSLSHNPPLAWKFYTADGALAAAKANLSLGRTGPASVTALMEDSGTNNTAAGHRRWILFPRQKRMGVGAVQGSLGLGFPDILVLWVIGSTADGSWGPAPTPSAVTWPPAGFVPRQVVFPRWSFTYPGADFNSSVVSMSRNGVPLPLKFEAIANGFGDNTLVWLPTDNFGFFNGPDIVYDVLVTGVKVAGLSFDFVYRVVSFDATLPADPSIVTEPTLPGGVGSSPGDSGSGNPGNVDPGSGGNGNGSNNPGGESLTPIINNIDSYKIQLNKKFKLPLVIVNGITSHKLKGKLPPGIKYKKKKFMFSGKPTKTGRYKVNFIPSNINGEGAKFTLTITVTK